MDREDVALNIIRWILRMLWKIFLILLWGICRLLEVTLTEINKWLKRLIQ